MGGATASIYKNHGKLMPGGKSLVVDYDLIMVTLPMSASGSLFGVTLSQIVIDSHQPFLIRVIHHHPLHDPPFLSEH